MEKQLWIITLKWVGAEVYQGLGKLHVENLIFHLIITTV